MCLPNYGMTHGTSVDHILLISVTLIPKNHSQPCSHPLCRGNHLSAVDGKLPRGNRSIWEGEGTGWDNAPSRLLTLSLSLSATVGCDTSRFSALEWPRGRNMSHGANVRLGWAQRLGNSSFV